MVRAKDRFKQLEKRDVFVVLGDLLKLSSSLLITVFLYACSGESGCGNGISGSITGENSNCKYSSSPATLEDENEFTVNTDIRSGLSIEPRSKTVRAGEKVLFILNATDQVEIESVSGCDGSLEGNVYTTGNITSDCTIAVESVELLEAKSHASNGGQVIPATKILKAGEQASFTLTPDNQNYVSFVSGCAGRLSNGIYTTEPLKSSCSVSVRFSPYRMLNSRFTGQGKIEPTELKLRQGETGLFTITPKQGHYLERVSGCQGSLSDHQFSVGKSQQNCRLHAKFSPYINISTVHTTGGEVTPSTATAQKDDVKKFNVEPETGFVVRSVAGCPGSLAGNIFTTASLKSDCQLDVLFDKRYIVSTTSDSNGRISPDRRDVWDGDVTTFLLEPSLGHVIRSVSGCGGSLSGNTYTTSAINENCSVQAFFGKKFTVAATASANGSVTPALTTVFDGDNTSFTVTPDTGYGIESVTGCGGTLLGTTYTTSAITSDCSISANFLPLYKVSISQNVGGQTSVNEVIVKQGETTSFSLAPNTGYLIDGVTGCSGTLSGNTYTTGAVTSDCSIAVAFIKGFTVTAITKSLDLSDPSKTNGTISPTSTLVKQGSTHNLILSPDSGYAVNSITGCNGTLTDQVYSTDAISSACQVEVTYYFKAKMEYAPAKGLSFTWGDTTDGNFYRLLENPDGLSGFTQVGSDILPGLEKYIHIIPLHKRNRAKYILQSCVSPSECVDSQEMAVVDDLENANNLFLSSVYFKASTISRNQEFGKDVAITEDGNTIAISAVGERSSATGINGDDSLQNAPASGAVYVFSRNQTTMQWEQAAYIKASNTGSSDHFGTSIALNLDGTILAVGAMFEDSGTGDQADNSLKNAGAVYIFSRTSKTVNDWQQQAYLKASTPTLGARFGKDVSLNAAGDVLAVGAFGEAGAGVDNVGAAFIYHSSASGAGKVWNEISMLRPTELDKRVLFGSQVKLNASGLRLAVAAHAGYVSGVRKGWVEVFDRASLTAPWVRQPIITSHRNGSDLRFGFSLDMDRAGNTLAIGAPAEDSGKGAAYVYLYESGSWTQQQYLTTINGDQNDQYGHSIAMSPDGDNLVVGAKFEQSAADGFNGDERNNSGGAYGAVYQYDLVDGSSGKQWDRLAFIKAGYDNSGNVPKNFGSSVDLIDKDEALLVGMESDPSLAEGVGTGGKRQQQNTATALDSGAAFLY